MTNAPDEPGMTTTTDPDGPRGEQPPEPADTDIEQGDVAEDPSTPEQETEPGQKGEKTDPELGA